MELTTWFSLLAVCTLGAMSPGPSLALIINITAKHGRQQGVMAALAHGLGVGVYALLAAAGLAIVIQQSTLLFTGLQLCGAVFLAYLGLKALGLHRLNNKATSATKAALGNELQGDESITAKRPGGKLSASSFMTGFLTAALNPKVALFFLALFSQFVSPEAGWLEKTIMASTAAIVDALWYVLVALGISTPGLSKYFSGYGEWLQKAFGVLLIAVAARIAFTI